MNKEKVMELEAQGYNISITGRNLHVTEAMKNYALEKISKIERFSDRIIDVHVTMDVQKLECRVDIVLKIIHTKIKSHASGYDMYVVIDEAVEKMKKQMQRYLSRLHDHHARHLQVSDMKVSIVRPFAEDDMQTINEEIDEDNHAKHLNAFQPHKIVDQEARPLKILTIDEAVVKMDLSQDAFLIFRAEHDMKIHVMYRRSDNDYGVIHVEG